MRVEIPVTPQPTIEAPKVPEKKDLTKTLPEGLEEDMPSSIPTAPGASRTYSLSSLKAAVDYHARFLTVAQNNIEAANLPPRIPQSILDRLKVG